MILKWTTVVIVQAPTTQGMVSPTANRRRRKSLRQVRQISQASHGFQIG